MLFLVPMLYLIVHSSDGNSVRTYEGVSKAEIQALLEKEGKKATFITESEFRKFIANNQPKPQTIDVDKSNAKKEFNSKTNTPAQRLNALIQYLELDK